jgi:type II secretory pathway pseudopilin PulG
MKNIVIVVFGLLALVFGGLYAREKSRIDHQTERVAELEARLGMEQAKLQAQTKALTAVTQEKERIAARAEGTKQKLIAARSALPTASLDPAPAAEPDYASTASSTPGATEGGGFKDYIGKMMKDPAMRKVIASSQGLALRQMYGDLVKQWNLQPEQASAFYDLLQEKQMSLMDRGQRFLADGKTPEANPSDDPDARLKTSLGDSLYQQYKSYEKSVGDRMVINQLQQHLAADNVSALSADQSQYLIRVMGEERQNQPPGSIFGSSNPNAFANGAFDQTSIDNYMKSQTELNQKVAQRAEGMLTPPQTEAFKRYQQQMLDMQKAGMEMATKMNGAKP